MKNEGFPSFFSMYRTTSAANTHFLSLCGAERKKGVWELKEQNKLVSRVCVRENERNRLERKTQQRTLL